MTRCLTCTPSHTSRIGPRETPAWSASLARDRCEKHITETASLGAGTPTGGLDPRPLLGKDEDP